MNEVLSLFDLNFEAHFQGPWLLVALAGFGLLVGVLTGLFGVGGGFLITPLLRVAFGVPYLLAIGSGLSFTIGTSSSGTSRHLRLGNLEPRCMLILAGTSMVATVAGATLNGFLENTLGEDNHTMMMHILFIMMLTVTAWLVGRNRPPHRSGKSLLQRFPLGPRIDLPRAKLKGVSVPGICAVGLLIGLLKGMMGIGGGVVFMPLLILVVGLTPHQAVGTSLGVVVFSSIAGAGKYAMSGNVNLCIVMALLVSSVFGVQIGAFICDRLHAARLRKYFALVVVLTVAVLAVDLAIKLLGVATRGA